MIEILFRGQLIKLDDTESEDLRAIGIGCFEYAEMRLRKSHKDIVAMLRAGQSKQTLPMGMV